MYGVINYSLCMPNLVAFYAKLNEIKLENVFIKHYVPNHMPDHKGKWFLKEHNSELHYGNCSKVNKFITPWSVISGSWPKRFFGFFVHKVVPIRNAFVRKMGVTQPKIYGIG